MSLPQLSATPLERRVRSNARGSNQMLSTSSGGSSIITLQFDLKLALDVAEQEVQAAINAATSMLPTDLPTPPIYNKVNPADTPILTLAVTSKPCLCLRCKIWSIRVLLKRFHN